MVQIHIGASVSQLNPSLRNKLDCAELSLRDPVPSPRTLRRWRAELGDDFPISLRWVVGKAKKANQVNIVDGLEKSEWLRIAKESAEAIKAGVCVVENAPDLRPTCKHLETLISVFTEIKRSTECEVAWRQNGLWEAEHFHQVSRSERVTLCQDPLQTSNQGSLHPSVLNQTGLVYERIKQAGTQQKLSDSTIRELVIRLMQRDANSRFLIIEGTNPGPLCKRLRKWVSETDILL